MGSRKCVMHETLATSRLGPALLLPASIQFDTFLSISCWCAVGTSLSKPRMLTQSEESSDQRELDKPDIEHWFSGIDWLSDGSVASFVLIVGFFKTIPVLFSPCRFVWNTEHTYGQCDIRWKPRRTRVVDVTYIGNWRRSYWKRRMSGEIGDQDQLDTWNRSIRDCITLL